MRRVLVAVVVLSCLAAAPVRADTEGGGTQIGGSVDSTLALGVEQTGATVRAVVTTTEPGARLSVASADGRSGLSASVSGPYAPLDPAFGLTLVAWDDVLAGRATTLRLKSASRSASTVLITLSATTP
jgi:hypothetical protein